MDIEHWNLKNLPTPPEISRVYDRDDFNLVIKEVNSVTFIYNKEDCPSYAISSPEKFLQNLREILQKMNQNIKAGLKSLKLENTALFAFVYQNGRHKSEKFMQVIKKIVKCMKNWEELNLQLLITNHLQMFPTEFYEFKRVRLPTTKNMHFLLTRLLGSYHLMMKASSYCLQAAFYLRAKLLTGHFFANATIAFSFVSRIRALSLDMATTIASSYDEVHPIITCLLKVCATDEYPTLPNNLKGEFKQELFRRSDKQENQDEGAECVDVVNLGTTMEENDNSEPALKKKRKNVDKPTSLSDNLCNDNVANCANERSEIDPTFSIFRKSKEDEDLGVHVSKENYALIKKITLRNLKRFNKQKKNLEKKGNKPPKTSVASLEENMNSKLNVNKNVKKRKENNF